MAEYMLIRKNLDTGEEVRSENLSRREIGQQVAWCATDNCSFNRRDAMEAGKSAETNLPAGEIIEIGVSPYRYEFRVEDRQ